MNDGDWRTESEDRKWASGWYVPVGLILLGVSIAAFLAAYAWNKINGG